MRRTRVVTCLAVLSTIVAVVAVACGGGGGRGGDQTAGEARVDIVAQNLLFDKDRIDVSAGSSVKVVFDNRDAGVPHNFTVYRTREAKDLLAGTALEAGPVVQELTFEAPPPGEYFFRCDVHPTTMIGTFAVK